MEDAAVISVLWKMALMFRAIASDPILLGVVVFIFIWIYLTVVWVRYLYGNRHQAAPDISNFNSTGTPLWSSYVNVKNDGMYVNTESVLRNPRNVRLGLSGVGEVRMADSGVVQNVPSRIDLGEIHLEGSGICPLELGIRDLECYLERHVQQTDNDLYVWLPELEGMTFGTRYVSMFELGGTLPRSISKAERIFRMWMVTDTDGSSMRTTVYVPFVPFQFGSVRIDSRVYELVHAKTLNVGDYLDLHARGEWGAVRTVDAVRNELAAIMRRGEIRSYYRLEETGGLYGLRIVTAEDHSSTCIHLIDAASVR